MISKKINFVSNFEETFGYSLDFVTRPEQGFFGRIGGSDTDFVMRYASMKAKHSQTQALQSTISRFDIVRHYNGYYDTLNREENIIKFSELMLSTYYSTQTMFIVGGSLLTHFLPSTISKEYQVDTTAIASEADQLFKEIGDRQELVTFYPYGFVERLTLGAWTLFRAFSSGLTGKRVLIVSPFSESIHINFPNRHSFFKDYHYPEFNLLTYNTPITYAGLPSEFYPDQDWHVTLDRMKKEISGMIFDIALLACGSYAGPLGVHIRDRMKKKAIYVGGCLQLYFGIMGRRYNNSFFLDQINLQSFIEPVEKEAYVPYLSIGPETAREAFGAYF